MTKFSMAPGLPGYGSKGIDGSAGVEGISSYFCGYDGTTDTVVIKSKIINKKILFTADELLPGGRSYKNGDTFIDKNGKIFEIDLAESNLYKDSGSSLNTSGYFTNSGYSSTDYFTRYTNSYATNRSLIDTVYSMATVNHTEYPTSIYGNAPKDYAEIKFSNKYFSSYYPFAVWGIGTNDNDSIALVRAQSANTWSLGNKFGLIQRTVGLSLDFSSINLSGNVSFPTGQNRSIVMDGGSTPYTLKISVGYPTSGKGGNVQIVGGEGYSYTTGTIGGDVSIWGGKGGNSGTGAGSLGGIVDIRAGATGTSAAGFPSGAYVEIAGGASYGGGNVYIHGGAGTGSDGNVYLACSNGGISTPEGAIYGYVPLAATTGFAINYDVTTGKFTYAVDAPSDIKFKTNLTKINSALNIISSVTGYTFNYNNDASKLGFTDTSSVNVGVTAQELELVFPAAVKTRNVPQSEETYKMVQYEQLIPLLIEGIKELKTLVEQQQLQINQLLNL
jgi:hypothetical protein